MKGARNSARHRDGVRANTEGLSPAAGAWSKREPLLLRALEPRILLDAAGAGGAHDPLAAQMGKRGLRLGFTPLIVHAALASADDERVQRVDARHLADADPPRGVGVQ